MNGGPLDGWRVLVTRPLATAAELAAAIEGAGGKAVRFPVIEIVARDAGDIGKDLTALPDPDIAIFVSRNAVRYGASLFDASRTTIAAIGPSTATALSAAGVSPHVVPDGGFDSEALLAHRDLADVAGKSVVIVRGDGGRATLGETLEARGASVHYLETYRRARADPGEAGREALNDLLRHDSVDCITVMSVASLENLVSLLDADTVEHLKNRPLVAPGSRVIQTAERLLPGIRAFAATGPGADDMLGALIALRHSGTS